MQHFTKLVGWEKAYAVALEIYRATKRLRQAKPFGLTTQAAAGGKLDYSEHRRRARANSRA